MKPSDLRSRQPLARLRRWRPLISCSLLLLGLACTHVPELLPEANQITITDEAAPSEAGKLPVLQVAHGLGRARGTREGALALLKNAAAELGAVRIHITHEEAGSGQDPYRIEAVAVMPLPLMERDFASDILSCRADKYGRRCTSELRSRAERR